MDGWEYGSILEISTHTLPRRATYGINQNLNTIKFQLTPSRGGRLSASTVTLILLHFNSHPPAEGDLSSRLQILLLLKHFNSHPPAEGD